MKRSKTNLFRYLLLIVMMGALPGFVAYSQSIQVSGKITDAITNESIPGATILEKGTNNGTVTNVDGEYTIKVASDSSALLITFIGYEKVEMTVGSNTKIDLALVEELKTLDEVIVIGYGTQKKSDKTGAVTNVTADELNQGVMTDPIQGLQGKASGVLITKKGGDPNEGFYVKIRGAAGIQSNTQPLYVVDGVRGVDPTTVSPQDIESFNILKDAASAAIYGSQGSNGVIIITTKHGKQGQGRAEFSTLLSLEKVANTVDVLSASELRSFVNDYNTQHPSDSILFNDGGANTDWQDEIYRTGFTQSYNLNFSGGNEKSSYYASVTRDRWEGVLKGTEKSRTNGKINIQHNALKDRLILSGSAAGTFEKNDYETYDGWDKDDIIYQALTRNPTDPVYNEDGTYNQKERVYGYSNPLPVIDSFQNIRVAKRYFASLKADLTLFKGLVFTANGSYLQDDNENFVFHPKYSYADKLGYGKRSYDNKTQQLLETYFHYFNTFGSNHNLDVVLGYSWQQNDFDGFWAQGTDPQSNYITSHNISDLNVVRPFLDIGSYKGMSRLIGFYGRVQYNYKSKYYLSGSLRRDGCSKFGSNNKWGWFPTVSASWNLDKEGFLENVNWLNQLKIRASYGVSGNNQIPEYNSIMVYKPYKIVTNPSTGEQVITFEALWNENPNLQWEQTSEFNTGLDFAFFKNRVSGTFDYYYKETKQLFHSERAKQPPLLNDYTWVNGGNVRNTGLEFFVQIYAISKSRINWRTSLTASYNKQEIFGLEGPPIKTGYIYGRGFVGEDNNTQQIMNGESLGTFYVPIYAGLNSRGNQLFKTSTGGVTSDPTKAQREVVGSAMPKYEIGWANNFTFFKNWNLDFSLRSWIGNKVYNATKMSLDNSSNIPELNVVEDAIYWLEQGRIGGSVISDLYVEDASFVRMDYLTLGYQYLPKNFDWIKTIKVGLTLNNVFILTGYEGTDPETKIDGVTFGIDNYDVYPKTRSYSLGLTVTF